jgi:outer membrane protein W
MKNLYLLLLCTILATTSAFAQDGKKRKSPAYNKQNKENDQFLEKQWWIGLKGGPNLTKTTVEKIYNVILPTNYDASTTTKEYDSFKQLGSQVTLEITFFFKEFSLSFQPTYQHARFKYTSSYEWIDTEVETNHLELTYDQEVKLDHLQLPLVLKYEFNAGALRPYVQIGAFSAILLNATKSVEVSGTDYASGGANEFKNEPVIVGVTDQFAKNSWGLIGGAGVYYNMGNVRLNFDVMYKYGMSNISSSENRYDNDRLSGVGDVMDDLTMDNLTVSIGCLFPLRFLGSGFKSVNRK